MFAHNCFPHLQANSIDITEVSVIASLRGLAPALAGLLLKAAQYDWPV
jgi:hypothetical protein